MSDINITIIWGIIIFSIVFLVNYFWIFKRGYNNIVKKNKKKKRKAITEFVGFSYLVPKFDLDVDKMNINFVFIVSSIINAFIISVVFVIVYIVPWNIAFRLLLGFVLLFGLIYALYDLFGRILVKKGWSKDENERN